MGGRDRPWKPTCSWVGHKIFTAASTNFGDQPNSHIDPVVLGLPRHPAGAESERCPSMR